MGLRVKMWLYGGRELPGGHVTQFAQTARHLGLLGIDARLDQSPTPDLGNCDLVHGYGVGPREIRRCKELGLPVALSTIYANRAYFTGEDMPMSLRTLWRNRVRPAASTMWHALRGDYYTKCEAVAAYINGLRTSFELADVLLPNSESEASAIRADLGVTTPIAIVPNAVDHMTFTPRYTGRADRRGVLYVGRIEPRKNQLALVNALRNTRYELTILGPPHPDHLRYYEACKLRCTANVRMLPPLPHEDLPAMYSGARVHALPSWMESPGLVSLEAALCGCNVVTSARGHVREFFSDFAWYCDPADTRSIRNAVQAAYDAPYREELRQRILSNYTWEHAARATLDAYEMVLARTRPSAYAATSLPT